MRKAGLKRDLDYLKGYRCGLDYARYIISKQDYQPELNIDCLNHKIRILDAEIKELNKEIYGWSD